MRICPDPTKTRVFFPKIRFSGRALTTFSAMARRATVLSAIFALCACGPKSKGGHTVKPRKAKETRPAGPAGKTTRKPARLTPPPAAHDLTDQVMIWGQIGSTTALVREFFKGTPARFGRPLTSLAPKMAAGLVQEILSFVGAKRLGCKKTADGPLAMAMLAPKGFSMHASFSGRIKPQFVAHGLNRLTTRIRWNH